MRSPATRTDVMNRASVCRVTTKECGLLPVGQQFEAGLLTRGQRLVAGRALNAGAVLLDDHRATGSGFDRVRDVPWPDRDIFPGQVEDASPFGDEVARPVSVQPPTGSNEEASAIPPDPES